MLSVVWFVFLQASKTYLYVLLAVAFNFSYYSHVTVILYIDRWNQSSLLAKWFYILTAGTSPPSLQNGTNWPILCRHAIKHQSIKFLGVFRFDWCDSARAMWFKSKLNWFSTTLNKKIMQLIHMQFTTMTTHTQIVILYQNVGFTRYEILYCNTIYLLLLKW